MGRELDPANPHLKGTYKPWKAYGQSKLANYHFAIGLHGRLTAANVPVASLLAHPGLIVQVEGHTDSTGTEEKNAKLSLDRASSVMDFMKAQGVDGTRMAAKGLAAAE